MIGALFCEDDQRRKELVSKIRSQFDAVLSISDIDEKLIQQILRTNKTALIECRSHRQIPYEISHRIQPVVIVGRKRAIVPDNFSAFSLPLEKLQEIDIPYGDYVTYEGMFERRNWVRKILRRGSKAHSHFIEK